MKKILLLGGSKQQIPAIKYSKEEGYYTVLCDYLSDNPGQNYADKFYCVSTTDKEAILEVARKENVNGIVAYASDPAALIAAYVAEKMGLPTNSYNTVKILTNKDKFREFLFKNKFCTPRAKGYSNIENIKNEIKNFRLPVIIKPVDSSGSKGVSKLDDINNLEKQFEEALLYSRSKRVIVEEFVEKYGYQVAGDGLSLNGKLIFRYFGNDHFDNKAFNPFVPISASFPYNMPVEIHDKIHREIQRLFDLLKIRTGAYNFDIRIDKDKNVYLMEVGPRNGGNYIPQVIKYATGIDMVKYTIKSAIGEACNNIEMGNEKGYWSYYAIHSFKGGILKEIKINNDVKNNNIVEMYLNYSIGDCIPEFTSSNGTLGILIMKFNSMNEMLEMMDNSEKWIEVIVE
ncbi:ATP-grasp domain-containing protein [Clostridium botulinum]|uniref:ATP-grasp domain-containing protein n=1 Tax=Clostridium botulinum TaxID=1491 RepID=UPI000773B132|nr:ATP-grasp domain-containing protein [Clostridium botulinum]NFE95396.1 ATP-grasp domain-containing protein [Clostridium botulinum]NFL38237.1 ATP-grasp domain-containing protein [Clostridium botulinum]NFL64716.1 ATP-grasp domain-containing protein [Clostridium botulinum]NFN08036.1 ATP-grasp domain-containing protein [Clostridium botulinum]NFN24235.1 ATP-grasp domain-containing protein [Clostridium botulinum]